MALPPGLSTVTVTGRFAHPDGAPMTGSITLTPTPPILTSASCGVILLGAAHARLVDGSFSLTVLATDDPDVTPVDWTYRVDEELAGHQLNRTYLLSLPLAAPAVDLAAVAPTDPALGEYLVVSGPAGPAGLSAYEQAVAAGFEGTLEQWLDSLEGPPAGSYQHYQAAPAATWQVAHGLHRFPNITIVDGSGLAGFADVEHASNDLAIVSFPAPVAGTATCS